MSTRRRVVGIGVVEASAGRLGREAVPLELLPMDCLELRQLFSVLGSTPGSTGQERSDGADLVMDALRLLAAG